MKYVTLFLFLFAITVNALSQTDSIKSEILNYQNNETEIISKARRMLADKLNANDFQKVKEIKDYLKKETENTNHLAFYTMEYWLILYWTQEFNELLNNIKETGYRINSNNTIKTSKQIGPVNDNLFEKLGEKSIAEKHILTIIIENASISPEERQFLFLHLDYCLSNQDDQEKLNEEADKFLLKYPSSVYAPFVKKVIRYKEKISQFGWGYDLYMGYGGFEGHITDSFSDYFVLGMSFDFTYLNFNLNMGFSIGGSELKKDIDYESVTWDKGKRGDVILPHVSLGYTILGNKRINFTPFAGISGTFISPKWEDTQNYTLLEKVELNSDASWNVGISVNFYSKKFKTRSYFSKMNQIQGVLKLRYTYFNTGYKPEYYGLDGAIHQVAIAFGGFTRKIKRSF